MSIPVTFGELVFNDAAMKARLPAQTYLALKDTIRCGTCKVRGLIYSRSHTSFPVRKSSPAKSGLCVSATSTIRLPTPLNAETTNCISSVSMFKSLAVSIISVCF